MIIVFESLMWCPGDTKSTSGRVGCLIGNIHPSNPNIKRILKLGQLVVTRCDSVSNDLTNLQLQLDTFQYLERATENVELVHFLQS